MPKNIFKNFANCCMHSRAFRDNKNLRGVLREDGIFIPKRKFTFVACICMNGGVLLHLLRDCGRCSFLLRRPKTLVTTD